MWTQKKIERRFNAGPPLVERVPLIWGKHRRQMREYL